MYRGMSSTKSDEELRRWADGVHERAELEAEVLDRPSSARTMSEGDDMERTGGFVGQPLPDFLRARPDDTLGARWREVESLLPSGWVFLGIARRENERGWSSGWQATAQWPGHCPYGPDCEHDEAVRTGASDDDPVMALKVLADSLRVLPR